VPLVVGARPDLAARVGADGVQLPERGPAVERVREAFPGLAIGRSCHDVAGLVAAARAGVDWVLLAPLRAPHTKVASAPPLGIEGFAAAIDAVRSELGGRAPPRVYALGGVVPDDVWPVMAAGGAGVATIGAVLGRPDPVAALRAFVSAAGGPG